jgi:hypothetical protein
VFKWLNKQGVESDDGFSVQFTGRFTADYREGAKRITVDVEGGANGTLIYTRSCFQRWAHPHGELTSEEQERAIQNFREAIKFQGLNPREG